MTIDDAESDRIKDVIVGRKMLVLTLEGYGTVGKKVFWRTEHSSAENEIKEGEQSGMKNEPYAEPAVEALR